MKATQIAPFGGPADAVFHRGRIVAAWQSGRDRDVRLVVAEIDPASHAVLLSYSIAIGDDVGAFPRLLSAHDSVWLIYRNGASLGGRAILRRDGQEAWRSPVECGGNDPVCLGLDPVAGGAFAWQKAGTNEVMSALCLFPNAQLPEGDGRPTGLSHFSASGKIVLVDDARGAVKGITRPSWAGDLVAGEHPDSGVRVLAGDGRELRIWPGEETVTPRLAFDPATGMHAVVTSGVRNGIDYGVRLATFTASELQAPVPVDPDAPFPPGKGWMRLAVSHIEVAPFLLGASDYARKGTTVPLHYPESYTHLYQSRRRPWGCQVVKALGAHGEIIRSTTLTVNEAGDIGNAFDDSNELPDGYCTVNTGTDATAIAYPRVMLVPPVTSDPFTVPDTPYRRKTRVQIHNLATGDRLDRVLWTAVTAVYWHEATRRRAALIYWSFDILGDGLPGDPKGVEEWSLCLEGDETFAGGLIAWRERHRRTGAVRTMYADQDVARIPDPEPRFTDALPVAPAPIPPPIIEPPPVKPPMTTPSLPAFVTIEGWRGFMSGRDEQDADLPWAPVAENEAPRPNYAIWAMSEARGWERWRTVVVSTNPLRVAFQSVWGHWFCCEGGGGQKAVQRVAPSPSLYEILEAESLGGPWWAFRASNGQYVVMEADGIVNANRDAIGGWERWKLEAAPAFAAPGDVIVTPPPPPPGGGSTHRGALRRRERVLFDDTGDRLILNTSMFQATTLLEHEPDVYADNLAVSVEAGIDEWRIGAAVNWPMDIQDELPTEPRHVEKIVEAIDRQWAAGIRTDLCLFLAQSDIPELATGSMCEDYTRRVCRALRDRTHAFRITIANEPGDTRVWRLGLDGLRRMRDVVRQELPGLVVGLGAPWHPESKGTCEWTRNSDENGENALPWFADGCDTVGPHYGRSTRRRRNARQPWLGRRDSGGTTAVMVDEEPIGCFNYYRNDGSLFNQNEQDPVNLGVYATASWMQGHAVYCFHTGAGIGYQRLARVPAYWRLREMPGLMHVGAAKHVLPGNLPNYRFANWGWSLDQGQLFRREYEPTDSDGTPPTRGHCATSGDEFVNHEFFGEREYDLIARVPMAFAVWDRQGTTFVQVAEHRIAANDRLRMRPCFDRLLVGRLV